MSAFSKADDLFGIDKFEEFKVEVLNTLYKERTDVFLCIKTGWGKCLLPVCQGPQWKLRLFFALSLTLKLSDMAVLIHTLLYCFCMF